MDYTVIDTAHWKRRETFEHTLSAVLCTYSLTTRLDITSLREKGRKLYPAMLYLLAKTVNQFEQFRMAINDDQELILYSHMDPC